MREQRARIGAVRLALGRGRHAVRLDEPLRLPPAPAGSLLPALLFGLLLQLGARPPAALLGGLAVALDNALLLLASFGSLSAVLAALSATRPVRRAALGLAADVLAGLATGAKFTGVAALALATASIGASVLPNPPGAGSSEQRASAPAWSWERW